MSRLINLATASARLGVPREVVLALKSRGLISPIVVGGTDYLDDRQYVRLQVVSKAQGLGFSLAELDYILTRDMTSMSDEHPQFPDITANSLLDRIVGFYPDNEQIGGAAAELRALLTQPR